MKQKDVMWWHIGSWLSICFTCLNISVGEINLQPLNIKQNFCVCSFFCVFALKENAQAKCDDLFDTYTTSLHYKQKTRCHYVNQQIRVWGWPDRGTSGMDHRRTSFSFSKMRLSFYLKACIVFCYRIRSLWGAFVWQVSSSRASSCIQPVHIQNQEVKFNTLPTINIWLKQL